MRQRWGWLLVLLACAAPVVHGEPHALAGTAWKLLAIHSMDDAQGSTRVADPARYTLSFAADGSVALRLDCNRGLATWWAESASADSGALRFEALATTRAACLPPALDQKLVRDLPLVRSYLWQGRRLSMSLLADGGIYEWEAMP